VTLHTALSPAASADCCPDGLAGPLSRDAAEGIARTLKAVADPTRLQLLALIKASPDGKACVCDLTEPLGLTQPTVSHHLKVLAAMGLLHRKRHGIWVRYSLNQDALDALAALLR
jgi:ArsR family transcriptional regulator